MKPLAAFVAGLLGASNAEDPQVHATLDTAALARKYLGNDAPWYLARVPFFESSDPVLTEVYYYRWKVFRAHQRDTGADGYVSTEFIQDVSWQNDPWATINAAAAFHMLEGRWSRDRRFKNEYATFLYGPNGAPRQYSESMADAVWKGYLVDGVLGDALAHLDGMQSVYDGWDDAYVADRGLYWVEPVRDATEFTIASIDASGGTFGFRGGEGFRPSINSYQYANAMAIANLAALAGGKEDLASKYQARAAAIKERVQRDLWNSTFEHFIDRYAMQNEHVTYWDPIRGRELVGYVPWVHDLPDDDPAYANTFTHLLGTDKLTSRYGLRTNEPSYEYYMHRYWNEGQEPGCQWNGPIWPYQVNQALLGLSNFLDHYPNASATGVITTADFTRLLRLYAQLHYNPFRNGTLAIEEDYDPDQGTPIVGLPRSPHYFHSGFVDVVLSGLVGVRPRADDVLEVNPLVDPKSVSWFRVERILYHGHDVSIQWDATGERFGIAGLTVEVDGIVAASSKKLGRLTIGVPRAVPPPSDSLRPVSVQLREGYKSGYPYATVSVDMANSGKVHSAIDGRTYFFPEPDVANGWETPVGGTNGTEVWYQVEFEYSTPVRSAEIAFFANDTQGIEAPAEYRIEMDTGTEWVEVQMARYGDVVPSGITYAAWMPDSAQRIRLVFTVPEGKKVRLVEWKIFGAVADSPGGTVPRSGPVELFKGFCGFLSGFLVALPFWLWAILGLLGLLTWTLFVPRGSRLRVQRLEWRRARDAKTPV